jgi:hypothetical protein
MTAVSVAGASMTADDHETIEKDGIKTLKTGI